MSMQRCAHLHDLGGGDGAVRRELGAQLLVVHRVHQVLDVQVHALVLCDALLPHLVEPAWRGCADACQNCAEALLAGVCTLACTANQAQLWYRQ